MGAAGRVKAQQQTWDHVATQMLELYNGQLSGSNSIYEHMK